MHTYLLPQKPTINIPTVPAYVQYSKLWLNKKNNQQKTNNISGKKVKWNGKPKKIRVYKKNRGNLSKYNIKRKSNFNLSE